MTDKVNLQAFAWFESRFKLRHYAQGLRNFFYRINMQFPVSHTERYKLRIIWYWYPLYTLGSLALLSFVIATITGIILGFYYVPSTNTIGITCHGETTSEAWKSIGCKIYSVPFGFMMRQLHFWSAMVMVAAVFLHMVRVFFTQAYKKPRELNWLIGVGLLVFTLGLGYTGYLLPWSQLSYWAGTIGLKMALATPPPAVGDWVAGLVFGGSSLGQDTLTRMYLLHVFLLPIITYTLIGLHIFIVWIQGIAEPH
ncbi:MAG: cytochrome b N-terminal domain-containing protein [Euryarchaeota archaeon]|nr:cytochrome b N-terminal domain-containing protein [Euryarchaeota archaeon]